MEKYKNKFDGECKIYNTNNDKIIDKYYYINGKVTGRNCIFFNEKVVAERGFINGLINGNSYRLFPSGNLCEKSQWISGKKDGIMFKYRDDKKAIKKIKYIIDKAEYVYITYYDNRKSFIKRKFVNNLTEDEIFEWNKNKKLMRHFLATCLIPIKYFIVEFNKKGIIINNKKHKQENDMCRTCGKKENLIKLNCGHIYCASCLTYHMESFKKEICIRCGSIICDMRRRNEYFWQHFRFPCFPLEPEDLTGNEEEIINWKKATILK
jgi:antitoxin component YwqK of YwqJK toxin-antitoxin module